MGENQQLGPSNETRPGNFFCYIFVFVIFFLLYFFCYFFVINDNPMEEKEVLVPPPE